MKKINLNLATTKKIHKGKFILLQLFLLAATAIFVFYGLHLLIREHRERQTLSLQNQIDKKQLAQFQKKEKELQSLLRKKQSLWQGRIDLCNALIAQKTFSFTDRLTFLEKNLPPQIQVETEEMENGSNLIRCTLVAPSYVSLDQTYRKLAPFGLSLFGESEKDNIFHITLSIRYPDENQ